jgi:hypothetical protein
MMMHMHIAYSEIKGMTRKERTIFQKMFIDEKDKEKEMLENSRKSPK